MSEEHLDIAIPRFKANEDRLDRFVNDPDGGGYTTTDGRTVPSVRTIVENLLDSSDAAAIEAGIKAGTEYVGNALTEIRSDLNEKEEKANKNQPDGYAGLGGDGLIPISLLPPDIGGGGGGAGGRVITPYEFGGVGDGVADDTKALNDMFAEVRRIVDATIGSGNLWLFQIPLRVDLTGGKWRITGNGVNATQIRCWNLEIVGGLLMGECAGVAMLDLVNTRGFTLRQVAFFGSKEAMPSCAFQLARDTPGGFCDNCSFYEVSTTGWFSTAAVFVYAHETALHSHCTYFNYNHDAYVAIFQGYNKFAMTSKFTTVMTGGTSFINNKVDICDFRYLPLGDNIRTITGVTIGTNPTITMSGGHSFKAGEKVTFAAVGGQDGMQRVTCTVASVTSTTFVAQGITTTGSYTGGGAAIRAQTKSSVYLGRAQDFNFDSSYIVAYGQPHLLLGFPDPNFRQMHDITLDLLFEGSGQDHNVAVDTGGNTCSIQGLSLTTYSIVSRVSLIGITGGLLQVLDGNIASYNQLSGANVVEPGANFAGYGCRLAVPLSDDAEVSTYAAFTGEVFVLSTGAITDYGKSANGGATAPVSFRPSVSCASGSYDSVSATGSYYTVGPLVFIEVIVTVNDSGTAKGAMWVQLPIVAGRQSTMVGIEAGVSGDILSAHIGPNNLQRMSIVKDDNQPPTSTASGTIVRVGGVYSRV